MAALYSKGNKLNLQKEQIDAACADISKHLIVVGPAGSGKTLVLCRRVLHLLEQGADPSTILILSFSNYTASEIKERLLENFKQDHYKIHQVHCYTMHKLCNGIIRDFGGDLFGLENTQGEEETEEKKPSGFQIATYEKQLSILKQALETYKHSKQQIHQHSHILTSEINEVNSYTDDSTHLKTILQWIHLQKCKYLPPDTFKSPYKDYYRLYEDGLNQEHALDFADLFVYAMNIVAKNPNAAASLKEKYRYILLDDTQELSTVQFELLKSLKSKNICFSFFGDDDQTISSSKGSFREVFLNLQSSLGIKNTIVRLLKCIYRFDGYICSAAQSLISRNLKRQIKKVECVMPFVEKNVLVCTENEEDEAKLVLDLTRSFLAQSLLEIKSKTHFPFKIIAAMYSNSLKTSNASTNCKSLCILARHYNQLSLIETTLRCNNISFIKLGAKTLLEREDVLDIVAHIVLASTTDDSIFTNKNHVKLNAFFSRVVNKPKVGLGEGCFGYLERLRKDRKLLNYLDALYHAVKFKFPHADEQDNALSKVVNQTSLWRYAQPAKGTTTSARRDTKLLSKAEQESLQQFYLRIESVKKKMLTDSISSVIEFIVKESDYRNYFYNSIHKQQHEQEALQNVNSLLKEVESLTKFSDSMQHNLKQKLEHFLQYCDVQLFSEEEQGQLDDKIPVVLATISQVKGMEFDTVVLLQFNERNFPYIDTNVLEDGYSKVMRDEIIENERKLAYFCMTRAKQKLFISYLRNSYFAKQNIEPSRFMKELNMNETCISFDLTDRESMEKKKKEEREEQLQNSFTRLDQFEDEELDLGELIDAEDEELGNSAIAEKTTATEKVEFQPTLTQVLKISKRATDTTPTPIQTNVIPESVPPAASKLIKEKAKTKPVVKQVIKEETLSLEQRKVLQNSRNMFQKWLKPDSNERKEEEGSLESTEDGSNKRKPMLVIHPNKSQKVTQYSSPSNTKQKLEEETKRKNNECELMLKHVKKQGAQGISFIIGQVCEGCNQSITRQQIVKLQVVENGDGHLKCPHCEYQFIPMMQIEVQCLNEKGQIALLKQNCKLLTESQLRNVIRKEYKLSLQDLEQRTVLLNNFPEVFWNILNQHGTLSVEEDKKIKTLFLETIRKSC